MNTVLPAIACALSLLFSGSISAQNEHMMNGGGWSGGWMGGYGGMGAYGGILVPILLVIVVAGLVVWVIKQKGK